MERLPEMRELDNAIQYIVASSSGGIDLSLLTETLLPPALLQEPDEAWDFDSLLRDVHQELAEGDDDDEKKSQPKSLQQAPTSTTKEEPGSSPVATSNHRTSERRGRRAQ